MSNLEKLRLEYDALVTDMFKRGVTDLQFCTGPAVETASEEQILSAKIEILKAIIEGRHKLYKKFGDSHGLKDKP
jgi:hypothetical protein